MSRLDSIRATHPTLRGGRHWNRRKGGYQTSRPSQRMRCEATVVKSKEGPLGMYLEVLAMRANVQRQTASRGGQRDWEQRATAKETVNIA